MKKILIIALSLVGCGSGLDSNNKVAVKDSLLNQLLSGSPTLSAIPAGGAVVPGALAPGAVVPTTAAPAAPGAAVDCAASLKIQAMEDILLSNDLVQAGMTLVSHADFCEIDFQLSQHAIDLVINGGFSASATVTSATGAASFDLVKSYYVALVKASVIAATGSVDVLGVGHDVINGFPALIAKADILDNAAVVSNSKAGFILDKNEKSVIVYTKF